MKNSCLPAIVTFQRSEKALSAEDLKNYLPTLKAETEYESHNFKRRPRIAAITLNDGSSKMPSANRHDNGLGHAT